MFYIYIFTYNFKRIGSLSLSVHYLKHNNIKTLTHQHQRQASHEASKKALHQTIMHHYMMHLLILHVTIKHCTTIKDISI